MYVSTFNRAARNINARSTIKVMPWPAGSDICEDDYVMSSDFDDLPTRFTDVEIVPGIVAHMGFSGGARAPMLKRVAEVV